MGELAATTALPVFGAGMPAIGPRATMNLFSGPSGSMPGFSSSQRILRAKPRPPTHFFANSSLNGSFLKVFVVRLILRILPVHPYIFFLRSMRKYLRLED